MMNDGDCEAVNGMAGRENVFQTHFVHNNLRGLELGLPGYETGD
jgi:hypothetical protein